MSNVKEFPKDVLSKKVTQKGKEVEIRVYGDGEGGWRTRPASSYPR